MSESISRDHENDQTVLETHDKRTETRACDLISRRAALNTIDEYERLSAVSQTVRNMTSVREIVQ